MKLNEDEKSIVKGSAKALINANKSRTDIDALILKNYVIKALSFLGMDADSEDISDLVHDLEYEVSVLHTKGRAIFNDYDTNLHDWYTKLEPTKQPFWTRYRRYLREQSSLDEKSINLLDHETLPNILNCLGNPNEEFEGKRLRRGLIIGDVQSGKTSTYTGLICKAADAGYKVVILLAGTTESLRQQTQERIDEGVIGYTFPKNITNKNGIKVGVGQYTKTMPASAFTSVQKDFVAGTDKIATSIHQHNSIVMFVCKKNVSVLNKLYTWIKEQNLDAVKGYVDAPMLLIDDEADNASVNTKQDETAPTRTNKIIRDICNLFKNATYVGFTATPFANIFIDPNSVDSMKQADLFPENFIYSLPTPSTYIGAKRLFYPEGDCYDNLRFIADIDEPDYTDEAYKEMVENDIETLNQGTFYYLHKKEWEGILPDSLRESVLCFLIANIIRDLRGDISSPRSMLVNMSRFIKVQRVISEHIQQLYSSVLNTVKYDFSDKQGKNISNSLFVEFKRIWEKHFTRVEDISVTRALEKTNILKAIENIQICVVNGSKSSSKLDYKSNPSLRVIAVGGLALSRGLTLEGLLTSYFYRNTATFDVLMQMGRWFGYRHKYEDIFQVWTSQASAIWYAEIAQSAEMLKEDIKQMYDQRLTPKDFGLKVRDNCNALQITAKNKMRSATDYRIRVAFYGNIYDTPYLSLNAKNNEANLKETQLLAQLLFSSGYSYRFADVDRNNGKDVNSSTIHDSRYFADVPKYIVSNFLSKIKCSLLNMNFNIDNLLSFMEDQDNIGIDSWDIVFEGGDGTEACQIPELSNINCTKRAIYDHGNAVQISSRRRILGTREGKFCLDNSEMLSAENLCKESWIQDGISEKEIEKKAIPIKAYFQHSRSRKPLLVIMLIQPEIKPEDPKKPNCKTYKKFLREADGNQLIAFAIGFPGVKGEEDAVTYKVNSTWLKLNGLDIDDESFNEEEYDG
ncbi:MAG: Z1 domain-containing protein [Bacteroides sp.]